MRVLIEYYDKDVLKNIVAPLTLKPDKVVYLHDSGMQDMLVFRSLRTCFEKHNPQIQLEHYPVDILSVEKIRRATERVILLHGAENCMLDLTGGSELMMIGGYKAGREADILMLHTDLVHNCIHNIETDDVVAETATLTLEDFIDAKGACFMGESHRPPAPQRYEAIGDMARYLFAHLPQWKTTCSYFQTVASRSLPHELYMESRRHIHMKNGKPVTPDREILKEFQRLGFLKNLVMDDTWVRFSFCSIEDKQYCISYGVWLELYVYIAAAGSGVFQDVKLGTMIDWDAYDGLKVGGNEIDVILMDDSLPVFISCKLRDADTAALNELLIAKKRLGGWFSKGVIVTFSNEKKENTGTYARAKELGLELLDSRDIMAADFSARLVKAIREHDLISLKWKKV
ncbi:MAG: DUF1887 family protein [Anaerotignum sp.]|nr:DUF1887 family protein [Anaerotignum sp.]